MTMIFDHRLPFHSSARTSSSSNRSKAKTPILHLNEQHAQVGDPMEIVFCSLSFVFSVSSDDSLAAFGRIESETCEIREQPGSHSPANSVLVHSDHHATKGRSVERILPALLLIDRSIDRRTRPLEASILPGEEKNCHSHGTNTNDFGVQSLLEFLFTFVPLLEKSNRFAESIRSDKDSSLQYHQGQSLPRI